MGLWNPLPGRLPKPSPRATLARCETSSIVPWPAPPPLPRRGGLPRACERRCRHLERAHARQGKPGRSYLRRGRHSRRGIAGCQLRRALVGSEGRTRDCQGGRPIEPTGGWRRRTAVGGPRYVDGSCPAAGPAPMEDDGRGFPETRGHRGPRRPPSLPGFPESPSRTRPTGQPGSAGSSAIPPFPSLPPLPLATERKQTPRRLRRPRPMACFRKNFEKNFHPRAPASLYRGRVFFRRAQAGARWHAAADLPRLSFREIRR